MLKTRFLILLLLVFSATLILAQEGDKTLPGEGEAVTEENNATEASILDDDNAIQEMLEQGDVEITLEDLVAEVDFSDDDDWEFYEEETRFVMVDDGVYVAEVEDNNIIWGQNFEDFEDGVISVVVTQDGGTDNNGFGVMCRANPDNNIEGYHFWISGEGEAAIAVYTVDDGMDYLLEWTESDAITDGENILHIVCVDEYLAFYVNGTLIGEVEDDTYDDGETGLSLQNFDDGEIARVYFDDLHIREASD